jgi:hypothetical protein
VPCGRGAPESALGIGEPSCLVALTVEEQAAIVLSGVAGVELAAEIGEQPGAVAVAHAGLGDIGDAVAAAQEGGRGDGLLAHQRRRKAADLVEGGVAPGGTAVRAEMRVGAVAGPVGERAAVAGRRVVERTVELLDRIGMGARQLPAVGDGGLTGANGGGQPLEEARVLGLGIRGQHHHDGGAQPAPGELAGAAVIEARARDDQGFRTQGLGLLDRAVAGAGIHDQDAWLERRGAQRSNAVGQQVSRPVGDDDDADLALLHVLAPCAECRIAGPDGPKVRPGHAHERLRVELDS